ncbi:MAG TPA: hypothetical protein ENH40_01020 [Nitrospirae bacterium]|nr:hypothetical protein BMS3Bbin08_00061 [bacterium BMS3Bbin08]HDZ61711.1 hypothetical protein [Nitrospirota bacterium]
MEEFEVEELKAKAKTHWRAFPEIRKEFKSFNTYFAYLKAAKEGKAKIVGKKTFQKKMTSEEVILTWKESREIREEYQSFSAFVAYLEALKLIVG